MTVIVIAGVVFPVMDSLMLRVIRVARGGNHLIDNHHQVAAALRGISRRPIHATVADHTNGVSGLTVAGIAPYATRERCDLEIGSEAISELPSAYHQMHSGHIDPIRPIFAALLPLDLPDQQ